MFIDNLLKEFTHKHTIKSYNSLLSQKFYNKNNLIERMKKMK